MSNPDELLSAAPVPDTPPPTEPESRTDAQAKPFSSISSNPHRPVRRTLSRRPGLKKYFVVVLVGIVILLVTSASVVTVATASMLVSLLLGYTLVQTGISMVALGAVKPALDIHHAMTYAQIGVAVGLIQTLVMVPVIIIAMLVALLRHRRKAKNDVEGAEPEKTSIREKMEAAKSMKPFNRSAGSKRVWAWGFRLWTVPVGVAAVRCWKGEPVWDMAGSPEIGVGYWDAVAVVIVGSLAFGALKTGGLRAWSQMRKALATQPGPIALQDDHMHGLQPEVDGPWVAHT